jgi:hypothetical protein
MRADLGRLDAIAEILQVGPFLGQDRAKYALARAHREGGGGFRKKVTQTQEMRDTSNQQSLA